MEDLLNAIKESNYNQANSLAFDVLYQKLDDKFEERLQKVQEECNCNNGNEGVQYEASDKDGDEYKKFFQSALKKFGVSSPGELEGDKKKKFYDYVDKNWKSDREKETGQEDPKESVENEGIETDIAKEKEKQAASQDRVRDLGKKLSRQKQRDRAEA